MAVDPNELPGQGQDDNPQGTDESASLPEGEGTSSGTEEQVDVVKELQDRLSQQGRELRDARLRAERAEGYVSQVANRLQETEARLESIGASLTAREQREEEAILASLPADQQEAEKLRRRVARLEEAQKRTPPQTRTREQEEAETVRMAQQMATQACVDFGLDQSEMFQWNDPRLDISSAETYYASARRLARRISQGAEQVTPPQTSTNPWGGEASIMTAQRGEPRRGAPDASQVDVKKIVEDTTKAVLRELQGQTGGAPHSARQAAPAASPFADLVGDRKADPYQRVLDQHRNPAQSTMRGTRAELRKLRDDAEKRFGQLSR